MGMKLEKGDSDLEGLKTRFGIKIEAVLDGKISDFIIQIWCNL